MGEERGARGAEGAASAARRVLALRRWGAATALLAVPALWIATARPDDPGEWPLFGRWPAGRFAANLAVSYALVAGAFVVSLRRLRRGAAAAAVCTGALMAVFALLEIPAALGFDWSRVLDLPAARRFTRLLVWKNPSNVRDELLIFRHRPGLRFRGETPGDLVPVLGIATERRYRVDIRYDRNGFRNETDLERADLVLIGDSYVEAGLVATGDLVSTRLAEALGVATANLGVAGYGPQQQRIVLERYALPLAPRAVLWFFFEGNDFSDAEGYEHYRRSPEAFLDDRFGDRSLWMAVLRTVSILTEPRLERDRSAARESSCLVPAAGPSGWSRMYFVYPPASLRGYELRQLARVQEILLGARELCESRGTRFLLVFVPTKFRVFAPVCRPEPGSLVGAWRSNDLPRRFARFAAERGIPFHDLTPALRRSAREGRSPFFPDDGHWNPTGHAVVAGELARRLREGAGGGFALR